MNQLALDFSASARTRDAALSHVGRVVSDAFRERGRRFVLAYLAAHGPSSGETLSAEGERLGGLRPSDARHWGSVVRSLSREGRIVTVGFVTRARGHCSPGGRVWALAPER